MRHGWLGIALGAVVGAIVACGGAKSQMATAPQSAAAGPEQGARPRPAVLPPSPHDEIDRLSAQIAGEMARLGLEPPVSPLSGTEPTPVAAADLVKPSEDPSCKPAARDTCKDSCTLGDSICGNAKRICDLAAELPADRWAADKCTTATSSCTAAHDRCCGCS